MEQDLPGKKMVAGSPWLKLLAGVGVVEGLLHGTETPLNQGELFVGGSKAGSERGDVLQGRPGGPQLVRGLCGERFGRHQQGEVGAGEIGVECVRLFPLLVRFRVFASLEVEEAKLFIGAGELRVHCQRLVQQLAAVGIALVVAVAQPFRRPLRRRGPASRG